MGKVSDIRRLAAFVPIALAVLIMGAAAAFGELEAFDPPWGAQVDSAMSVFESGDPVTAAQLLKPLAEAGDAHAQYILGSFYDEGLGVSLDHCRALHWYELAAELGLAEAAVKLGESHFLGRCMSQDLDRAAQYYTRAAALGGSSAQGLLSILYDYMAHFDVARVDPKEIFELAQKEWDLNPRSDSLVRINMSTMLGHLYANGEGVQQNLEKAAFYYSSAARQGLSDAQYFLALLYLDSPDEQKHAEGLWWLLFAAEQTNEQAVTLRDELISDMPESRRLKILDNTREIVVSTASNPRTRIGKAAHWCRSNAPESYECLRFAFSDDRDCDPHITEAYFDRRYVHSRIYDRCRREAFHARRTEKTDG